MAKNRFGLGTAISLVGIVAVSPIIAACGGGNSYENWAATDGAAGSINPVSYTHLTLPTKA